MLESFGPESTNPRLRRAYAHSLRDAALVSGKPEDKLAAQEAANAASHSSKGHNLGAQTLKAILNQYEDSSMTWRTVHPVDYVPSYVSKVVSTSWIGPEYVKRHNAVVEAMGLERTGVTITKPTSPEEYYQAAIRVRAEHETHANALYAEREGLSYMETDYSVPGTHAQIDAARALGWDTTWDHASKAAWFYTRQHNLKR